MPDRPRRTRSPAFARNVAVIRSTSSALFRLQKQRERVAVKDRPLRDQQRELRVGIGERADLRRDELLVPLRRRIEIEGELAVEDFLRHGLDVEHADGLLRELLDAELFELRCRLHDRGGAASRRGRASRSDEGSARSESRPDAAKRAADRPSVDLLEIDAGDASLPSSTVDGCERSIATKLSSS